MRRRLPVAACALATLVLAVPAGRAADREREAIGTTPLVFAMPTALDRTFVADPGLAALGRRAFEDTSLSEPRGLSCASCHDPAHGMAGTRAKARGVAEGSVAGRFGSRNIPALRYARYVPPLRFVSDESDDDPTPQPHGGLFHDGRVDGLATLPHTPLVNPREMNNRDDAAVARKLRRAAYAPQLRRLFGDRALDDPERAVAALGAAIRAYLESDEQSPFSSRYDAFIAGRGRLTPSELEGMRLFRDPSKGNCGGCHAFNPDSTNPLRSMFTDFGYDAVGAPRNADIPVRTARFDLGLCETATARRWPNPGQWCGYFRTPTLRNVAVRDRFMHNGVFADLRTVVEFYASRSTDPGRWYPGGAAFDDLPERYRANVNVIASPWNRRAGAKPGLDAAEIDAVVAFLGTLTDRDLEASTKSIAASGTSRPSSTAVDPGGARRAGRIAP